MRFRTKGSEYPIFEDSDGPKNHEGYGFGTRDLKYWVLGPSGSQKAQASKRGQPASNCRIIVSCPPYTYTLSRKRSTTRPSIVAQAEVASSSLWPLA